MNRISLLLIVFLTVALGCSTAKKASEVSAVYVPASQYANLSCDELFDQAEEIRSNTRALEIRVDESRRQDKIKEQVAWWLFAPAAFMISGNADEQTGLALAKGQLDAIRTAAIKAKCNV